MNATTLTPTAHRRHTERFCDFDRAACTDAYNETEKLIYHTCHRFRLQYGGDIDELISRARELFVTIAFTDHDDRSNFSTYVRRVVWLGLLDDHRRQADRYKRRDVRVADLTSEDHADKKNHYWLTDFVDELSRDATVVVRLTLDVLDFETDDEPDDTPAKKRRAIKRTLAAFGWSAARIAESFNEIARALGG